MTKRCEVKRVVNSPTYDQICMVVTAMNFYYNKMIVNQKLIYKHIRVIRSSLKSYCIKMFWIFS